MKKHEQAEETILEQINPEKIKEVASDAADAAAKFIKKYPLESVGGALLAGVLLGLWIKRK